MKIYITILSMFFWVGAQSQDSLTMETLDKMSYSFTIEKGEIHGSGAEFFKENITASQFTMMGEYHGSQQIALLTEALIPMMHSAGYKTFIAEVGPQSANVLARMGKNPATAKDDLKKLNAKYNYEDEEYTSIPFFYGKTDADFYFKVSQAEWDILGIDQEFFYSYIMLFDEMYQQIPQAKRNTFSLLHSKAIDTLQHYYALDYDDKAKADLLIQGSVFLQNYMNEIEGFGNNAFIARHVKKSLEIYALNSNRKWFENNQTRVRYMKENLREGMKRKNFNVSSDKAFLKMGAYHLPRGYNPMGLFDVGNTINELAEFHGNTTFSFTFLNRYFTEDGNTSDMMKEEKRPALANFIQMGKKDKWTIIDLRSMIAGTEFHPVRYKLTAAEEEFIKHYDVVLIPPIDQYVELWK